MIRTVANLAFLSLFLITALLSPVYAAQYNYDNLHRLTRVIYDNGLQITYTYDEVGNCTRRVSTLMADISVNGTVDFQDFAILASQWLDSECHGPAWCEGTDIDWSTVVDIEDLATLAQQWLRGTK